MNQLQMLTDERIVAQDQKFKLLEESYTIINDQLQYKIKETFLKTENNLNEKVKKIREDFEAGMKKQSDKGYKDLIDNLYSMNNKLNKQIDDANRIAQVILIYSKTNKLLFISKTIPKLCIS